MLILCGAPLGNPADASTRLRETLATAEVVAAEDTRRLVRLARDLSIEMPGKLISYFEGNEEKRTPELVDLLRTGTTVALITDGGMPSVSDPGYRLVTAALAAGVPVTCAPGPSAVTTALALSGLPVDRFCFEGFLPRTGSARRARLAELAAEPRTLVFFESTHRIEAALRDLASAFGPDRAAALCRELTKTYEEVRRAPLGELSQAAAQFKGEITLVVAGASPQRAPRPSDDELRELVAEQVAAGLTRRDAIEAVAAAHALPKREVYAAAVTPSR
ncbi:MAG: 16S rRNA (cytidine(1402)-2'-O)-methyltransferase [Hamadaea sp.]|nr:16S rRNA (cytidine(1402)-2'-O)-methyltransferase [Hamadaea sp.]NUR49915.1 16S rRNA (cytidine(1402)-2'-O)-methyltransferase [Hamadaea sp.]NUT02643.1 16S rRNA (cytidine(1402)-2'-O)-methyltransferase [Hamadaea sp.]